jgi:hypothetical protein
VPSTVLRVPSVRRVMNNDMTKRERRVYDAVVDALKGEGCRAGGKRLAATDGVDYPMCRSAASSTFSCSTCSAYERRK